MALAQELMGLGVAPALAQRIATAGAGPVTVTATGTGSVTAANIYGTQYIVSVTGAGHVILPAPTGTASNLPLIADSYVVNNGTTDSVTVWPPAGVTINIGGHGYVATDPFTLVGLKTLQIWSGPSTTKWFGLSA